MDWKKLLKKIPRRKYLRPKPPSKLEKSLGFIILAIIIGIGTAIYIKSKYYDPNLFRIDPKLINKTSGERVEAVRVTSSDRQGSIDGEPVKNGSSESSTTSTPATSPTPGATSSSGDNEIIPVTTSAADWSRKGDLQKFNYEHLYDKVDGREDLYKSYEFHELLAADYVMKDQPKKFIQVELFDMTTPKSAYGIFTAERPSNSKAAKIGREAYTDTNGAFFWKGKYYVRVIGSDSDASTLQAAIAIANNIESKLADIKDDSVGKDPLPKEDQVTNSSTFVMESAFGQAFFKNVNSAKYKIGKFTLTGFIMPTESPDKAKAIVQEFGKAMESMGKLNAVGNEGLFHLEAYGSHYVIFAQGSSVGGVMEADDKDAAIKLGQQLMDHLKKQGK